MTQLERAQRAQHEAINALALLAETDDDDEAMAVQEAMTVLHERIFSVSFESVYQKSRTFLQQLNESLGVTDEAL